jgi:hypothetical protein
MVTSLNRPMRIVAYTTAAAALHDWGVTPVDVFGHDPREDPVLAGVPVGRVGGHRLRLRRDRYRDAALGERLG